MVWTWTRLHKGDDVWSGLGRILRQAVKLRRETSLRAKGQGVAREKMKVRSCHYPTQSPSVTPHITK